MRAGMLGKVLASSVYALILCAPVVIWLVSVRDPVAYFTHSLPPGQLLFVLSKLAALFTFCFFWMQCMLGLAPRTPLLCGFPTLSLQTHRRLGLATAGLALTHVVLFLTAASYRTGAPAWNLLLPNFTHGYYNALVSLGLIALWLLALGVLAGWRVSRGKRSWRAMHMVWPVVFALVFVHAFAIGSESRYGAMRYLCLFMAVSLSTAALSRAYGAWRAKRAAQRSAVSKVYEAA